MDTHETPVGTVTLAASAEGLTVCTFAPPDVARERYPEATADPAVIERTRRELDDYFAGRLREFTVPVDLRYASAYHRTVLAGLGGVGYGRTTTYGRLAADLGLPTSAARGVGGAMAGNPVLIVVPCHRVLGSGGALVGYAGGLEVKRRLLDLEGTQTALDFGT
ncbi:methylated-DNA--[protein]-cysteine S-methyltransferase [Saccharothrix obliqua]|uniref:methylated-DNA--[protein]-cysteine S-methyltransferase n=1 Tax=Saccharothrix obliqua TaxID=2861747 RepID=UPI0027E38B93|nr:methylated-DNA--[protein]-cysteine S-methyltransferase [Saccharothrix obliqua]